VVSFVEILAFLAIAVVVTIISKRTGVSNILLFLVIGTFVGPECLKIINQVEVTEAIGNIGVIFLLFTVGLHLPIDRLKMLQKYVFVIGPLQVIGTTIFYFLVSNYVHTDNFVITNVLISFAISLSSTAIVVEVLNKDNALGTLYGKTSFGILLFQDFAVIIAFALLPLFYVDSGAGSITASIISLVKAFVVVTVLIIVGRYSLKPVFRFAAQNGSEIFIPITLIVILGTAYITNLVGMSMELGAFLAGLLLAGSEYRLQVEAEIDAFKGLLLGMFFLSVGMSIKLPYLYSNFPEIANVLFLIFGVKFLVLFVTTYFGKLDLSSVLKTSFVIAGGGEFAFVLFAPAVEHGLMADFTRNIYCIAISFSMALTPVMAIVANFFASLVDKYKIKRIAPETLENRAGDIEGHVIIAGFGRVGQTIASLLSQHFIPFIAIDDNMNKVTKARAKGLPVFYGDAKRSEIFRMLGVQNSKMVIVTLGRPDNTAKAATMLLKNFPNLKVWLRLNDSAKVEALQKLGANIVVPQLFEASLQLGEQVLGDLGITAEDARQTVEKIRAQQKL